MRRAIVDIGSNSVLLLISERKDDLWTPLYESTKVTGLGEGTGQSGQIHGKAMTRTLEALRTCKEQAFQHKAEIRYAGTMALRIAANAKEFVSQCAAEGMNVEILTGQEEAEFGFRAVVDDPKFSRFTQLSILDPGGHSTELTIASKQDKDWSIQFQNSFPIGALSICESHLTSESPGPDQRLGATMWLDQSIQSDLPELPLSQLIVLGATGTNLVSIRESWSEWHPELVHGSSLSYEEVGRAVGWLCDMTLKERAKVIGLEQGREKTIHSGALILERIMHAIHAESCLVSTRGWRHAFLQSWLQDQSV